MSDQTAGFPNPSNAWNQAAAPSAHHYPLQVRDYGLGTAISLLVRSAPYAVAHFGILLGCSVAGIIWLIVMFGGAAWLGTHIAHVFGIVWFIGCLVGIGWLWGAVLRYMLHLLTCGHVAVLTDLITTGQVGNGSESMLAYGKRVVLARFGQVNALYGLNLMVRGIINSFHRTLDWIDQILPIPGLESLGSLVAMVLRAATRYLDKVILSYNLARGDGDPWIGARQGLVYYAQNAKPILMTSLWIVVQERVLTVIVWLVMLAPAAAITVALPPVMRESGGVVTLIVAVMLAYAFRAAFIKPLFLIKMIIRYHGLIENQPINQAWDERLASISDKFRTLGTSAAAGFRPV
ncbi:MAG TPA: hypothetical protein VHB27_20155 [Rhodopila sp.]|uniref:hypothetical protein n=1 Tax=Rhodopila sp. TaxID=2480087 RepID=UPI002C3283C2|nr:hypothetical protein [Rhodopila sp.]HVY17545.1 hypothetical protein [Rhodopila sp.]